MEIESGNEIFQVYGERWRGTCAIYILSTTELGVTFEKEVVHLRASWV